MKEKIKISIFILGIIVFFVLIMFLVLEVISFIFVPRTFPLTIEETTLNNNIKNMPILSENNICKKRFDHSFPNGYKKYLTCTFPLYYSYNETLQKYDNYFTSNGYSQLGSIVYTTSGSGKTYKNDEISVSIDVSFQKEVRLYLQKVK